VLLRKTKETAPPTSNQTTTQPSATQPAAATQPSGDTQPAVAQNSEQKKRSAAATMKCVVAVALYEFKARNDRELDLKPNEEIAILKSDDSGWSRYALCS
jgi:hypothetical protein